MLFRSGHVNSHIASLGCYYNFLNTMGNPMHCYIDQVIKMMVLWLIHDNNGKLNLNPLVPICQASLLKTVVELLPQKLGLRRNRTMLDQGTLWSDG